MKLTNATALPASVSVSEVFGVPHRVGIVVAKATFSLGPGGKVSLETQRPMPLFARDERTELGLLPRDDLPRRDAAFEVILLGAAHAPGGLPTRSMVVALSVGARRRELWVRGDRRWVRGPMGRFEITPPQPFVRMPLTWERAFGGTCEVYIDRDAVLPISYPYNPAGKGFDPGPSAEALCRSLGAPEGFPVYNYVRELPNVESPEAPIERWADAPRPACWATVPMESALHAERMLGPDGQPRPPSVLGSPELLHRAHPDWIIERPPAGCEVVLEGLTPEYKTSFRLPPLRVFCDYVLGTRGGTLELLPHALVLLPEQARFYVVYRAPFAFVFEPRSERAMRLRLEEGWYPPDTEAMSP